MMYKKYTIIGSGISGINAALTLLKKGHTVEVFDLDDEDNMPINTNETFDSIKVNKNIDSLKFFYGDDLSHLIYNKPEQLFTFPARRKGLTKENIYQYDQSVDLFEPQHGYCKGGLGSFWGANSVEFNQDDLIDFGIKKSDFQSIYSELSDRFNISGGIDDDISRIANSSFNIKHSRSISFSEARLLNAYSKYNSNDFKMGQSRLAINSDPLSKNSCYQSGLCIWRCPKSAIYDPKQTLLECMKHKNFKYIKGITVLYFKSCEKDVSNIKNVVFLDTSGKCHEIRVQNIILAAGAINSSIIYLRSLYENGLTCSKKVRSSGLMDTQVIKIPYINPYGSKSDFNTSKVQFNNLSAFIKIKSREFPDWAQAELLSLGSLIYYPLINKVGLGLKNSLFAFNKIKNSLSVSSIFIPDQLDKNNYLELDFSAEKVKLNFHYHQSKPVTEVKKQVINTFIRNMRKMGMLISKSSAIHFKHGDGIHYAGTIPIKQKKTFGCVDNDCKSYDFSNLYVVDGSVFPSLPSKSISLNLAANAIRVANKL